VVGGEVAAAGGVGGHAMRPVDHAMRPVDHPMVGDLSRGVQYCTAMLVYHMSVVVSQVGYRVSLQSGLVQLEQLTAGLDNRNTAYPKPTSIHPCIHPPMHPSIASHRPSEAT
jgi:hypothetical protein